MANLSTSDIEEALGKISDSLSGSKWSDDNKNSYLRFVEDEKKYLFNLNWVISAAEKSSNNVDVEVVNKLASSYSECLSKFNRLNRG